MNEARQVPKPSVLAERGFLPPEAADCATALAAERRRAERCKNRDQELKREPFPCLINSAGSSTYPARKSVRRTRATPDETFVKLLDRDRSGRAHTAYLWTYLSIHEKAVLFEFSPSRGADNLRAFFPVNWSGVAQTDGYQVYPSVFRDRPNLIHLECMAHLRRRVVEAVRADELEALPLLKDITELYRIEREADARGLSILQRGYWRHGLAKPVLKRLQRRFLALSATALPASKLGEAVTYAKNRWSHLAGYAKVGFGHVSIDQNPIERIIRPTKVGSRNWLFIGNPKSGWCSAVIYSIVGTCRLLGVNPEAYLTWVLPKLAAATNRTAAALLPHDYARGHPPDSG